MLMAIGLAYSTETYQVSNNILMHVYKHYKQYERDLRFLNISSLDKFLLVYINVANKLNRRKVGKSNSKDRYVGFIDKQHRLVKYDKKYKDFIVYIDNEIITMHKKSKSEYDRIRLRDFYKEFRYNEDLNI